MENPAYNEVLECEIVLTRLIDAPKELVFAAFTTQEALGEWFGPDEQQNKKTVVSLRQLHPTSERRSAVIGFGAVEFSMQTMDKLAAYLQNVKKE